MSAVQQKRQQPNVWLGWHSFTPLQSLPAEKALMVASRICTGGRFTGLLVRS
jgi:hypothetical protein